MAELLLFRTKSGFEIIRISAYNLTAGMTCKVEDASIIDKGVKSTVLCFDLRCSIGDRGVGKKIKRNAFCGKVVLCQIRQCAAGPGFIAFPDDDVKVLPSGLARGFQAYGGVCLARRLGLLDFRIGRRFCGNCATLTSLPPSIATGIAVTWLSAGMTLIGFTVAFLFPSLGGWLAEKSGRIEIALLPAIVFMIAALAAPLSRSALLTL
nr:hypothetical protein [Aquicoccus porphyridii]